MVNHRYKKCEGCNRNLKERSIIVIAGVHNLCKRCYRSSTSTTSFIKADRVPRRKKVLKDEERDYLNKKWSSQGVSEGSRTQRLSNLRLTVYNNHKKALSDKRNEKPYFKKQFDKLVEKK